MLVCCLSDAKPDANADTCPHARADAAQDRLHRFRMGGVGQVLGALLRRHAVAIAYRDAQA